MKKSLEGKNAVVTGGTGAIGSAVVQAFVDAGADVTVPYKGSAYAERKLSRLSNSVRFVHCDITDEPSVVRLFSDAAKTGALQILVNCAGGFWGGKAVRETGSADAERLFKLNFYSAMLCSREFLARLTPNSFGRIVNFSALTAVRPQANKMVYAASKSAVITLTKVLAMEEKNPNFTVNAIAPGMVRTEENLKWAGSEDISMWVTPERIAQTVLFLCSDEASAITGTVIELPGGIS